MLDGYQVTSTLIGLLQLGALRRDLCFLTVERCRRYDNRLVAVVPEEIRLNETVSYSQGLCTVSHYILRQCYHSNIFNSTTLMKICCMRSVKSYLPFYGKFQLTVTQQLVGRKNITASLSSGHQKRHNARVASHQVIFIESCIIDDDNRLYSA